MSAAITVRRALLSDADALGDVHVRVWRWAYRGLMPDDFLAAMRPERRSERWRADLMQRWLATWVAESDGRIVAFAGSAAARDEDAPPTPPSW